MKKVGLGQGAEWEQEEQQTVKAIQKAGVGVELNTGYFKFGKEPYPGSLMMKMLALAHIPVLISDDAHAAGQLGNHFEETSQQAKTCGLKELWNPFSNEIIFPNTRTSNFQKGIDNH